MLLTTHVEYLLPNDEQEQQRLGEHSPYHATHIAD